VTDPARLLLNRTLDREPWARAKLAAHSGKTFRVVIGPATFAHAIDAHGELIEGRTPPELTLTISPLRLPALLAQPARWGELVEAQGDAALAETLAGIALTLPMFVDQALASMLGPVVGSRVAAVGARVMAMPDYAAQRFGDSVARYIGDESRAAVQKSEAGHFAADVAALSRDVDALEVRVDALGTERAPKR
jgi:ubiquinone biosynthesis accessory factor UbiJ